MKTNMLRKFLSSITPVGVLGLALICFSNPTYAAGGDGVYRPAPVDATPTITRGYLVVYTPTQQMTWGCGDYYFPHTGYRIYDASGKSVEWVPNHNSRIDEDPQRVKLPPGNYTIRAPGIAARVQIKLAETTTVHLDN